MAELLYMTWKKSVPIFKNSLILKQLALCIGIPFGILLILLIYAKAYYASIMVLSLLFLTFLFVMVVYGGKYDVEYVLDKKGVRCRYQENQRKKNAVVNTLLIAVGFFSSRPTYAGAGMLAASRQDEFLAWKKIRTIKVMDRKSIIILKGGFAENITLFCQEDEFEQIKEIVKIQIGGNRNGI